MNRSHVEGLSRGLSLSIDEAATFVRALHTPGGFDFSQDPCVPLGINVVPGREAAHA